ncbi:MAG: hypothetical protein H6510_01245 [Acidobacteria bacterium]|nr:hypothetical protein [Acidobacteriota bacterium]MCB9396415.1 hypothetical protein [Acidobacteriota bacterium]
MFKKAWSLLALAAVGSMVFATVDLRTNIQDIYYRGTCEEAGSITMSVDGDDFFEASTETPVFIRIRLDKGGRLCSTLVNRNSASTVNVPIYLAMRYEGTIGYNVSALPETVSIVRWRAGEDQIWLRVQTASNTWLQNPVGGGLQAPDANNNVAWTFGVTARNSWTRNSGPYGVGLANLPANTTDVPEITAPAAIQEHWAVSTLICVNVSTSILEPSPNINSELNFDTISYDYQTTGVFTASAPSGIVTGDQTSANFSGDDTIARGVPISCSMTAAKPAPSYEALCAIQGTGQNGQDDDTVCMTNAIRLNINCTYGWNGGSSIIVSAAAGASYGFPVLLQNNGNPVPGPFDDTSIVWGWAADAQYGTDSFTAYTNDSDIWVDSCGNVLTDTVVIYYDGNDNANNSYWVDVTGTVCQCINYNPTDVVLSVSAKLSNRGVTLDVAPFDGETDPDLGVTAIEQRRRCPSSVITVGPVSWPFGTFGPCVSNPVVIFYPYLPKLYDTPFWTGVSYVNQGGLDFAAGDVIAHVYEADGSYWTASFPALPVRWQHTWLLAEDTQGVGFYDTEGTYDFVPLVAGSGDLVPMDKRASMFIIGATAVTYTNQIFAADLDGFCLIGNTETNVVYGYTPRNYDNSIPLQNADLPILRAKK